jgi:hypothetical protein
MMADPLHILKARRNAIELVRAEAIVGVEILGEQAATHEQRAEHLMRQPAAGGSLRTVLDEQIQWHHDRALDLRGRQTNEAARLQRANDSLVLLNRTIAAKLAKAGEDPD